MEKITEKELEMILKMHKMWLEREWQGKRADLSGVDLRYADLRGANLKNAILKGANLVNAYLENADLTGALLNNADLSFAFLNNANLSGAILTNANLFFTHLEGANLKGACLDCANLRDTHLDESERIRRGIILKEKIAGYYFCSDDNDNEVIVEFEVPKGAIVFSINNWLCRTNIAKCVKIYGSDKAFSIHGIRTVYEEGRTYEVENFDLQYNVENSNGVLFFRTKEEAEELLREINERNSGDEEDE